MRKQSTLTIILAVLLVIAVAVAGWLAWQSYGPGNQDSSDQTNQSQAADGEQPAGPQEAPRTQYDSAKGMPIVVSRPLSGSVISNPLMVSGTVPGSWSFEASFALVLHDSDRKELARSPASLDGDWMTDEQVPFSGQLEYDTPSSDTGYLVLERANPSDRDENADQLEIPIRFR